MSSFENEHETLEDIQSEKDIAGSMLEEIIDREKAPLTESDLNEILEIGYLNQDSEEYKILSKSLSDEQIKSGHFTRKQLLDSGFIFSNKLTVQRSSQQEKDKAKPLIDATIDGVDYGKRLLLTKEELNRVIEYQQQIGISPELSEDQLQDLRKDILITLKTANPVIPGQWRDKANAFLLGVDSAESKDKKIIENYLSDKGVTDLFSRRSFINENLDDIIYWDDIGRGGLEDYRGLKLRVVGGVGMRSRSAALDQSPSPFLDSSFRFGTNEDISILDSEGKARRLNSAVLHLASRGLSEMTKNDEDADRRYMTLWEYQSIVYLPEGFTREKLLEKADKLLSMREDFDPINFGDNLKKQIVERLKSLSLNQRKEDKPNQLHVYQRIFKKMRSLLD